MQRFQQGSQSVEDYYQELQKCMIHCAILEEPNAAIACFRGGLYRKIQHILDYKEYADMTQLMSFLAKRDVKCRDAARGHILTLLQVSSFSSAPAPPAPSTPTTAPHKRTAKPVGAVPTTGTTPPIGAAPPTTAFTRDI
jgi:hypothetical protein